MTDRYGTFVEGGTLTRQVVMPVSYGIIDRESGDNYYTTNLRTAERLAKLLNRGTRAQREADYLQGWVDRDRECPITESGKRCAKRYVDGAASGLLKDTSVIVGEVPVPDGVGPDGRA